MRKRMARLKRAAHNVGGWARRQIARRKGRRTKHRKYSYTMKTPR